MKYGHCNSFILVLVLAFFDTKKISVSKRRNLEQCFGGLVEVSWFFFPVHAEVETSLSPLTGLLLSTQDPLYAAYNIFLGFQVLGFFSP